jgi:hypothetical protein
LPQYNQAKEIYWIDYNITKYFRPLEQAGVLKVNSSDLSLYFKNTNSWIRLKGADKYDTLRGSGLDLIVWDEVRDVKEDAFDAIGPSLADSPDHRVLYISTPRGLNHFHDFVLRGDRKKTIPALHIERAKQEAEEKGKVAFFNQEYLASFEESAGRFFPRWNYKTHVLPHVKYPKINYIRYGSMDWGRTAPFSWHAHFLMPVNHEGLKFNRLVTFREVYSTGKSPYEQAQDIVTKTDYRFIKSTYTDPSMFDPLVDGSTSIAKQFQAAFKELIKKHALFKRGSRNRIARWAAMENWMRIAPDGLPYWMITEDCPNLIRTIPLMTPDPNKMEDLDTSLEDHAIDDVSYFAHNMRWIDAYAQIGAVARLGTSKHEERKRKAKRFARTTPEGRFLSLDIDEFAETQPHHELGVAEQMAYKRK